MSQPDPESIRVRLRQPRPGAPVVFEEFFEQAIWAQDFEVIQSLVIAAAPLLDEYPKLRPWFAHAQGALAINNQDASGVISWLEPLWQERADLPPALRGRVLNNLGLAYEMNEQWDRALHCYQESVALCKSQNDEPGLGVTLSNLALVYHKAGELDEASACARQSIAILGCLSPAPEWQVYLGTAWNTLGLILMEDEHRLDDARDAFTTARDIWTRCEDPDLGIAYHNLGDVHRLRHETDAARQQYQRASELLRAVGNDRQAAEALYWLAVLAMEEHAASVGDQFDAALQLARETHNYEIITQIFLSRADLHEQLAAPDLALEETRQAVATVESLRANIVLPDDRARLTASRITAYEQLVARLCRSPAGYTDAFYYAEMSKSRALVELLAGLPLRPPEHVPPSLLEHEADVRQSLDTLYHSDASSPEQIATLEAELHRVREYIRLQDADFQSFQTVNPLTLAQVQDRLPPDSVLLEYFTIGERVLVFVVQQDYLDVVHLPLTLHDLRRAFSQVQTDRLGPLHNLTPAPDGGLRPPWILRALCQKLIDPIGDLIWEASMLCIVPHGILHHVPFHALYRQTPAGPAYLHGDLHHPRPIVYAPGATVLLDSCQRKPRSPYTGGLALGANNGRLTQAEAEAHTVAHLVGGSSRTGTAATRATLLQEAATARYLHLSCHGSFNATWPMASTLSLSDGTLDVTDVLRELRLNAELVVLSACETGYSHVLRGDELIGFIRAFLYAGTPAVLVSQWVVDELSTRLLMERFYQEVLHESQHPIPGATARALARAQSYLRTLSLTTLRETLLAQGGTTDQVQQQLAILAAMAGYANLDTLRGDECLLAHPYYWAPFFLVGDRMA